LSLPEIFKLGMARLFQENRIFRNLTVRENIMAAFPGNQHRSLSTAFFRRKHLKKGEEQRAEKADKLLDIISLAHRADALGKNISYGEQRLLAIGRLLITDAPILLIDEPSSGVRLELADTLFKILKSAAHNGRIVLVVEHNLDLIHQYADMTFVICQNGIQEIPKPHFNDGDSLSEIIVKMS
jgi:ABC-type branched-subunit amino acid transport system ATPase component